MSFGKGASVIIRPRKFTYFNYNQNWKFEKQLCILYSYADV